MFFQMLAEVAPVRVVRLFPAHAPMVVIASDGRADDESAPSASVLLHNPANGLRMGLCTMLSKELQSRWSGEHCIGEVESVPLVLAVVYLAKYLVGRDAVWWIDNSSTLGACIKGGSRAEDLDRSVSLCTWHAQCWEQESGLNTWKARAIGRMAHRGSCFSTRGPPSTVLPWHRCIHQNGRGSRDCVSW